MKIEFLNHSLLTVLLSAFILITLPSCDKEDETPERSFAAKLTGTWDVTSYILSGDEWMEVVVDSVVLTFQEPTGNSGIFYQDIAFAGEEILSFSGRYIFDEALMQVTMYYEEGPIVGEITFAGKDKMLLEGTQDGNSLTLKATKRL